MTYTHKGVDLTNSSGCGWPVPIPSLTFCNCCAVHNERMDCFIVANS